MRNATFRLHLPALVCILIVCSILVPAANSAILNNGKNNKKVAVSKHAHVFTLKNGFQFRGGNTGNSTNHSGVVLSNGYLRFVKGNTVYIIPYHHPPAAAGTVSCEK